MALLYKVAIFLRLLLPYFGVGTRNTFMRFIYSITEPLLRPLRRFFTARMFDLSPFVAIILVDLVVRIIVGFIGPV
jgi:YggT family protein